MQKWMPAPKETFSGRGVRLKGVRAGERLRIAVGHAEQQADLFALPDRHAGRDLDPIIGIARENVQRRVEAQAFLHRRGGLLPAIAKKRPRFAASARMTPTALPAWWTVASWPGIEQQDRRRDKFVLCTASGRCPGRTMSCVSRSSPGLRRRSARISRAGSRKTPAPRALAALFRLARAAMRVHRDHPVRPVEQLRPGIVTGTPSISAITVIGTGVRRRRGSRSNVLARGQTRSTSSLASASTRGRSRSTWRETKARLTSVRSRVWAGGSSSSIEVASSASKSVRCDDPRRFAAGRECRPGSAAPAAGRAKTGSLVIAADAPMAELLPEEGRAEPMQPGICLVGVLQKRGSCGSSRRRRVVGSKWR